MAEGGLTEFASTFQAVADLRTSQYHIMRFSAADQVNIASNGAALSTVGAIGVLQNKPNSGQFATIQDAGVSKVVAGSSITAGAFFTTNGSGRAIACSSGNDELVVGRAITAPSNDGETFRARLFPPFRLNGSA